MKQRRLRSFNFRPDPLVYVIGGVVAAFGSLFYLLNASEDAGVKLTEETTLHTDNGTTYALHSAHAVREEQGEDSFIYNFDNKTVSFGSAFHRSTGGMLPFSAMDEQEDISEAREKGCAIAKDLIPGLTDYSNWVKGDDHDAAIKNARNFIKNYCP